MSRSWFTPATARRALARVRPLAESVQRLYGQLEARCPRAVASDQRVDPLYFSLVRGLATRIERLAREGVRLADPRVGLVDFPARRAGRPVYLCWKVGETSLEHWHEIDGGFAGRRPVDEDGPWDDEVAC